MTHAIENAKHRLRTVIARFGRPRHIARATKRLAKRFRAAGATPNEANIRAREIGFAALNARQS